MAQPQPMFFAGHFEEDEPELKVYCVVCSALIEPEDVHFDRTEQKIRWACPNCETKWACVTDDWPPKSGEVIPLPAYMKGIFDAINEQVENPPV